MTGSVRATRTREADALCARAYADAGCPATGVAMLAVGGYGREELAPYSDLDVVLVLDDGVEAGEWAAAVWYPLWDSGAVIDHSVRTLTQVLDRAGTDLKVALGMLDMRHLAGDPNLTLRLRTAVLAAWRRDARRRVPELRELVVGRADRLGELADAAVPDLKESAGGLRDGTVLKALVATWLVDVPHADLERCRRALLDARDALHLVAGRATDRVAPEYWAEIAEILGLDDALAAQQHLRGLGRRLTHLSRLTWRRVEAVLRRPRAGDPRRPQLQPIGRGIAVSHEEVVLDRGARSDRDPLLLLRAAAAAAERDLVLAPATAARLARRAPPLPDPWPAEARDLLVRLLAAGRGMLPVWETLEETGAVDLVLPEWRCVRLLPHSSLVHRFTVDRHLVETCIEASALIPQVSRPDVLVVAALLHDIGKGEPAEHAVAGAPVAREVARRIGFDQREADLVSGLVRWHLLLPEVATTRDLEDPATLALVTRRVHDREGLDLLATLTEADARATSDQAWTPWRAGLVRDLVRRTRAVLEDAPPAVVIERPIVIPDRVRVDPTRVSVEVGQRPNGSVVLVTSLDRAGLLADIAATLALQRLPVRSARAWTQQAGRVTLGVSEWLVAESGLDAAVLRQRLEAVTAGRIDLAARLRGPARAGPEPTVGIRPDASGDGLVIEVRAGDRPGLIHTVCTVLAGLGLSVRSAQVNTLGPQAVDVFHVREPDVGAHPGTPAVAVADAVRAALAR